MRKKKRDPVEQKKSRAKLKKKWLHNMKAELRKYLISKGLKTERVEKIVKSLDDPETLRMTNVWTSLIGSAFEHARDTSPKTPVQKFIDHLYSIREDKSLPIAKREEADKKLDELLQIVIDATKEICLKRKKEDEEDA